MIEPIASHDRLAATRFRALIESVLEPLILVCLVTGSAYFLYSCAVGA